MLEPTENIGPFVVGSRVRFTQHFVNHTQLYRSKPNRDKFRGTVVSLSQQRQYEIVRVKWDPRPEEGRKGPPKALNSYAAEFLELAED